MLMPSSTVYSFGIGNDVSFDLGVIGRYGCTVHGFDPTPRSIAWVASNVSEPRFVFHELGIGARDGEDSFEQPKQDTHVSYFPTVGPAGTWRFKVNRLVTIMKDLGHGRLDILKMDVEGFEYAVLADMIASGIRPRAIAVEFHHRMHGIAEAETIKAAGDLRDYGYRLFHVSDTGREYSFIDMEPAQ
jgi:FkbM family methyltransferase